MLLKLLLRVSLGIILFSNASHGLAESFQCSIGANRTVEIVYSNNQDQAPCEVIQVKNGSSKSLWRANNDVNYCKRKYIEYFDKLNGLNLDCNLDGSSNGNVFESNDNGNPIVSNSFKLDSSCSYYGEDVPNSIVTFDSDQQAVDVIKRIVEASGLKQNFTIKAGGVPNAAAVQRGSDRYILYNQTFMNDVKNRTGSRWAAISIMAHEVGHHLNAHTLDGVGSRPDKELEADSYSGFILNALGASLKEAQLAMQLLNNNSGSSTHPAKRDRLAAIANGWTKACDRNSNCSGNSNPSPTTNETPTIRESDDVNESSAAEQRRLAREERDRKIEEDRRIQEEERNRGLPSGTPMQNCGCWGSPTSIAREPRCESGQVQLQVCGGFCPLGGQPFGYSCR